MTYLITGASGQLGTEFVHHFQKRGLPFAAPPETHLDITNAACVKEAIAAFKPSVILNCAAYNDVEKAEEDATVANAVNGQAVEILAEACKRNKIFLVHYGTDFVFDGLKEAFYTEEDQPGPLNNYGLSKLLGERYLKESGCLFLLFRVSWVFGPGKQNFLYKLQTWSASKPVIKVVDDQVSVPTYTGDIVSATVKALEQNLEGLYHLTNNGCASRYDIARFFLGKTGYQGEIIPVSTSAFPSKVARPAFSAMSNDKLSSTLQISIPTWENAVDRFVKSQAF
ncbi:MAG: dTDP-4-dehydrorhamnose reductase [Lentisphaeria bacterium]|nr:dTDP-4-dehydrorhamnose reductase [Lentisphaeria bacterium]